jgi:hypothetical protein
MFAKRHYEVIALALQASHPPAPYSSLDVEQWEKTRDELAKAFVRHSSQFKRDRFERACSPGANVRART